MLKDSIEIAHELKYIHDHPLSALYLLAETSFDGYCALSDLLLGLSMAGARRRNLQRGKRSFHAQMRFIEADVPTQKGMILAWATEMLLSDGIGEALKLNALATLSREGQLVTQTERRYAISSFSQDARNIRKSAEQPDFFVYKSGNLYTSTMGSKAQYHAPIHPNTSGFANMYGLPIEGLNFVQKGRIKSGEPFVTSKASAIGRNSGGAIEIVTKQGGVEVVEVELKEFKHLNHKNLDLYLERSVREKVQSGFSIEQAQTLAREEWFSRVLPGLEKDKIQLLAEKGRFNRDPNFLLETEKNIGGVAKGSWIRSGANLFKEQLEDHYLHITTSAMDVVVGPKIESGHGQNHM